MSTAPTHATIVVTVRLNDNTAENLGGRIERELRNAGADIVPCGWAPDLDTIADVTPGADWERMVLIDLNPGLSHEDFPNDPNFHNA